MEHIKTPLRMRQSGWAGTVEDVNGVGFCEMLEDLCFLKLHELVKVVNERDARAAQRDALIRACEMLVTASDQWMIEGAVAMARIALALVKGGTSE